MTPPAVSVLMTAYNRDPYIAAAIESVLGQTFADFELIVVDDASSDRTVEVAHAYARRDSRVRVHVNGRNLGDYANRNHAASLARGRLLKYHDSDDVMYPHCLATMVPLLEAEPRAGFALSAGGYWPGGPCPMLLTPRMCYQREFLGLGLFMCGPASALFRADVLSGLGGFENVGAASDYVFWLKACARHAALLVPGDLFWYRRHAGQELASERAAREYAEIPGRAWRALHDEGCPLDPAEREQARRNQAFGAAKLALRAMRAGQWSMAAHRIRRAGLTPAQWVKYLRRPRRAPFAGTPTTGDGEFVIPAWVREGAVETSAREPA
jgi:hypothetical protein